MAKKAAKAPAAPKPAKLTASAKPRKKSELFSILGEHNGLSRKQIAGIFETLGKVISVDLAKPAPSKPKVFVVPGMMKVQSVYKPATKARQGINPFTKQPTTFAAKPASKSVRARPIKAIKDAVA